MTTKLKFMMFQLSSWCLVVMSKEVSVILPAEAVCAPAPMLFATTI